MGYNLTSEWKEEHNTTLVAISQFEPDYLKVFQIGMVKGRFLSNDFPSDRESGIVINERAAAELDYKDPVGKKLLFQGKYFTIVGILDDYMANPPIINKSPLLITCSKDSNNYLVMRINPANRELTHQYILKTLKKFNADYPVDIRYHSDLQYQSTEAKSYIGASRMMHAFFILTILTTLIGIFGLSMFIAQRFRKETGIRKVFGASVTGIMFKLSRSILFQAFISIVLATPVSFLFSKGYLSVFPLHPKLGIMIYLFGGALILVMLILTISWQTWKAASQDPVHSLRYE